VATGFDKQQEPAIIGGDRNNMDRVPFSGKSTGNPVFDRENTEH